MADDFESFNTALAGGAPNGRPPRAGRSHANGWSRCAGAAGLLSALGGAGLTVDAVAPGRIPGFQSVRPAVWVGLSVGFAALSLLLVVLARLRPSARGRRSVGAAGIVLLVCGLLFTGCGLLLERSFPEGLIKAPIRDEAPVDQPDAMDRGIDKAVRPCTAGWQSMSVGDYPGVSVVRYCKDPSVAWASFDNGSAVSIYRAPVQGKFKELVSKRGGAQANADWCLLSGGRWMVVGLRADMVRLQAAWGGELASIG
ncbi:hypothetical protein [Bifidobacterium xylocopae]|uniref:Uncharacterized protein n=1 Tax=Bifidobacterium xylocopae TaxID=2493119 RepID=A0A366KDY2_9BIFI|nr:hypothetical protein [Bifidobacterium xylocopae]RBP99597.1 hypothetical protein CRD59_02335 [Bifidobacterium xylocopae]